MNRNLFITSAVVAAALSMAVVSADAQGRGDRSGQRGGGRTSQGVSAPRQDSGRQQSGRQDSGRQAVPRGNQGGQSSAPQSVNRGNQGGQYSGAQAVPRGNQGGQYSAPQGMNRGNQGGQFAGARSMPRSNDRYGSQGYRNDDRRGYSQPRGGFGGFGSRTYARPRNFVAYRPYYFSRSYYSFRPRLNIGFGLWLGYSVAYPWSYYYDGYRPRVYGYGYGYGTGYGYNNGYYAGGSYYADRNAGAYGGLSFDIQPSDADLYIDGEYVGQVGVFTPYGEPLTLVAGVHHIAVVRDGYRTMEWDVTVEPGMVLPYQGAMEPW